MPDEKLLTSAEVAALFGVDPRSVARWVKAGKLPGFWTPGGRLRFRESVIRARLAEPGPRRPPATVAGRKKEKQMSEEATTPVVDDEETGAAEGAEDESGEETEAEAG